MFDVVADRFCGYFRSCYSYFYSFINLVAYAVFYVFCIGKLSIKPI